MAKKIINTSGTRKTSVARVTLKEGTGLVRINGNAIETHTPEMARMKIIEPLLILEDLASKVDIQVNVFGGGINSQAEAARLAIARALAEFSNNEKVRQQLLDYSRNLLIADVRRKEACKPNTSKARAKRQKSYR